MSKKGAQLLTEAFSTTMMQCDLTQTLTQFGGGVILSLIFSFVKVHRHRVFLKHELTQLWRMHL